MDDLKQLCECHVVKSTLSIGICIDFMSIESIGIDFKPVRGIGIGIGLAKLVLSVSGLYSYSIAISKNSVLPVALGAFNAFLRQLQTSQRGFHRFLILPIHAL